jgi:hypothetical protein
MIGTRRMLTILVAAIALSGCNTFQSSTELSLEDMDRPIPWERLPQTQEMKRKAADVAAQPPGALVKLGLYGEDLSASGGFIVGTVLQAHREGVALINAKICSRQRDKDQPSYSRRPVLWDSTNGIATVKVLAPPPPGYVAPQITIDPRREPIAPEDIDFDLTLPAVTHPSEQEIAALPPGALVKVGLLRTDGSTAGFLVGTLLHASSKGVALFNAKMYLTEQDGHQRILQREPLRWHPSEGIAAIEVLALPPADVAAPTIDIDPRRGSFEPRGIDFDFATDH